MATSRNSVIISKYPIIGAFKTVMENGLPRSLNPNYIYSSWCEKSASKAIRLRYLGDEFCRLQEYELAFEYYSRSVSNSPIMSEELALAFGNRSFLLLKQGKYELCLLDVNRALNGPLPVNSKVELQKRKQSCWERLLEENAKKSRVRKV